MPYIRLYARDLSLEQKRVIAQELIQITIRTFRLNADQRYQTSVQFVSVPEEDAVESLSDCDFTLEIMGRNLTDEKKKAFGEAADDLLTNLAPVTPWRRIMNLMGVRRGSHQTIVLQFHELNPAISEPFYVQYWAAA